MEPTANNLGRRKFLKTTGGFVFFIGTSGIIHQFIACSDSGIRKNSENFRVITAWVKLADDGRIIICNPAAEMGQGSMTSLPAIFAEEMDADWDQVRVVFSPQEAAIYGSEGWSGDRKIMLSAGSRVTSGYYQGMRKAGAQVRKILLKSAALHWDVPLEELETEKSVVRHPNSNRAISYAEVMPLLSVADPLPDIEEGELKNPGSFRLIGTSLQRTDIPSKTDGSAKFAIDLRIPGMLYACLERGRVHGAKPSLQNEAQIMEMDGVVKVIVLDHGVGVIASRLEEALEAKKALQITWSGAPASGFNSQEVYGSYRDLAKSAQTGEVITKKGDFLTAQKQAHKTFDAEFSNDYVYHAQMEPLNAIVRVEKGMENATVWVGSQQGFDEKLGVPSLLGIDPGKVNIELQYLGGGFGRRSMTDFVTECAALAREIPGKPVKLVWTREDDLTYGAYRPLSLQRLRTCIDQNGSLTGFSHIVVGDGGHLVASGIHNEHYDIPNQWAEWREVSHGIRLKHWRSVGHGPNKFAIECMIDDVARELGKDPVEFRMQLMVKSPRALATLKEAAKMANWAIPPPPNRARGVAFLERSGSLVSGICEISVDRDSGEIRVHHFWTALDAGIIVQPDNVVAQMEGGIIMGISSVLKEQLTIEDGKVQQSNFNDYNLLRMTEIPESVETSLIDSAEPPQGVGESGTPLVAPAIANAFLSLTGKHLRHLPFTRERVLEVLNS
jgi:isoquinoline 1-oxidoreductase beta subunit